MNSMTSPELLLATANAENPADPFLTVAIPHYKHRRYLEIVLTSLFAQTYQDFEILISDDCSPDDSNEVIPPLLKDSGRAFRYYAQAANLGYDGNVRFCLRAARGKYVFLLGNDDSLTTPDTLREVAELLQEFELPDVAFTNFEDWETGTVVRKAFNSRLLGVGPSVAVTHFRSFSFVSGAIYRQEAAVKHETDLWDSSIYYQIYIACRILAAGGSLAAFDVNAVRKDVRVADQTVPNYVSKWAQEPWSLKARHTGLESVIRVTAAAVLPLLPDEKRSATLRQIVAKVFLTAYPYWLFEYRRVSGWSFAVGIARDLQPVKLLREYTLNPFDRMYLYLLYSAVTTAGLIFPAGLFNTFRARLADYVRYIQQLTPAATKS